MPLRPRTEAHAMKYLGWLVVLSLILLATVAPVVVAVREQRAMRHFAAVTPGVLYRSAQLPVEGLKRVVHDYGIRTVICIRDESPAVEAEREWCQRNEVEFIRTTRLQPSQMALVRAALGRDFESASQDNGYLLRQISQRYADGDAANLASIWNLPQRINALTPDAIQQAAQVYLTAGRYVKVTLVPQKR